MKSIPALLSALLGIGVFLFWWQWHPEALSFQEQNQLFLWTWSYLWQRLSVAGGLADWLGEFIVQFFRIEWLGALLMAALFVAMQRLGRMTFAHTRRGGSSFSSLFPSSLSFFPSLLSFLPLFLSVLPPLFFLWLMGDENVLVSLPVAATLFLSAVVLLRRLRPWWWLPVLAALYWSVGTQWTTYYRIPHHGPDLSGWDADKWELLRQDYYIRYERWDDLLRRAKEHEVRTPFWSNSVNLALAMTGQLADHQFDYWQSGDDALIMPMVRDNVSNLPTMEAFWRLGMVNSCLRYASDLEESILNARKSGRLEQRIVECLLVNGNDSIARKHQALLDKTLFYRGSSQGSALQSVVAAKRQLRYRDNFLYNYGEIDKMLAILFQTNPTNTMALEYFLGQLLLKGDAQTFIGALPWAQQHGGYQVMPMAYQDAVGCMQSRQVPDTPYGRYIRRKMEGGER